MELAAPKRQKRHRNKIGPPPTRAGAARSTIQTRAKSDLVPAHPSITVTLGVAGVSMAILMQRSPQPPDKPAIPPYRDASDAEMVFLLWPRLEATKQGLIAQVSPDGVQHPPVISHFATLRAAIRFMDARGDWWSTRFERGYQQDPSSNPMVESARRLWLRRIDRPATTE
jgi:hypothetical protein